MMKLIVAFPDFMKVPTNTVCAVVAAVAVVIVIIFVAFSLNLPCITSKFTALPRLQM
jgi:hypothetical protein